MLRNHARYGLAGIAQCNEGQSPEDVISRRLQPWLSSLSKQHMSHLSRLSVFGGPFNAEGAAALGIPDSAAALNSLHECALLQKQPCSGQRSMASSPSQEHQLTGSSWRYSMHPLMRVAARAHLSRDRVTQACTIAAFLDFILLRTAATKAWCSLPESEQQHAAQQVASLAANEEQNIQEVYSIVNHSRHGVPSRSLFSEHRAELLRAAANGFWSYGHQEAAYLLMRSALKMLGELQAPGMLINVLHELSEICGAIGHRQDEEAALRRAVRASDHRAVPSHLRTTSNGLLAGLLADQGKLSEAEPRFRTVTAALRLEHGQRHSSVFYVLYNFGLLLRDMGKLSEAEAAMREALDICREVHGPKHAMTGTCLKITADLLYLADKELQEADEMEGQALDILEACLPTGLSYGASAAEAGNFACLLGGHQAVGRLWEIVIRCRGMQGQGLQPTARWLSYSADALVKQGKLSAAEAKAREALDICSGELGSMHSQTIHLGIDLAFILQRQGKELEAEALLLQAVSAGNSSDPELEHTVRAKIALASAIGDLGKCDEAIALLCEVLAIRSRKYGPDHPLTANCCNFISIARAILAEG